MVDSMNPDNYQQTAAPEQPEQSAPRPRNPLEAMQPGEQNICEIKRHPIGIIGNYIVAGVLIVGALVAGIAVEMFAASLAPMVWGVGLLLILVAFVMLFVGTKIYWGNRWIVTSDSITQVTQTSLFDTQSSQLSMGNIEDVTVEQDGMLQHMYNYGLLRVETAGEHSKFVFPFCPNPKDYARQILNTREQFEQGRRGDDNQRLYRGEGAYTQQYGYQQQPPMPMQAPGYPPQQGQPYPPQQPMGYPPQQGQPPYPPQEQQPQETMMPPMPPANPPYDNGGMPDQQS